MLVSVLIFYSGLELYLMLTKYTRLIKQSQLRFAAYLPIASVDFSGKYTGQI